MYGKMYRRRHTLLGLWPQPWRYCRNENTGHRLDRFCRKNALRKPWGICRRCCQHHQIQDGIRPLNSQLRGVMFASSHASWQAARPATLTYHRRSPLIWGYAMHKLIYSLIYFALCLSLSLPCLAESTVYQTAPNRAGCKLSALPLRCGVSSAVLTGPSPCTGKCTEEDTHC